MSASLNERTAFIYKLGGNPAEVDVFALAPTLLALGELIQESNRTLYPEGRQVAVNVKPFKEGSFLVDVVLYAQEAVHPIIALTKDIPHDQLFSVLSFVGIARKTGIVAKATSSVLDVIKKLKGKPTRIEELKPGEYRYSSGGNSITVPGEVHTLIQNNNVTNNVYRVYAKPLEETKFDNVESYLEDQPDAEKTVITRDDVPALRTFATTEAVPEEIKEKIIEGVLLNPKRGAFEGDGSQWSFHRGDDVITATIRDEGFLRAIEIGEIRPNHSDLMTVVLKETQKVAGTVVKTPKYEILKVTDYKVGPRQSRLQLLFTDQGALSAGDQTKALPPASETENSNSK